jgi:hypothetical protein
LLFALIFTSIKMNEFKHHNALAKRCGDRFNGFPSRSAQIM